MIGLTSLLWIVALADMLAIQPKPAQSGPGLESQEGAALLAVSRVYVDRLTGGATAAQMRDLIITALQGSKLFVITENEERADAVLRGAAEDLLFTDKFNSSDSLSAHSNAGQNSGSSRSTGTASSRSGRYGGLSLSENESSHIEERKHEAMATVRLVNKDGDVIWSTTQESLGGKFRGASADVAERIAKKLAADVEQARKTRRLP
jgi:hypothetical protein